MNRNISLIAGLVILLNACASGAQKPQVAAPIAASVNYDAAELDKRARQMGYHVVMRNAEKRYCQYGAAVGSHISSMHCLSPEAMAQAAREDEELEEKLSRRGNQLCPSCIQKN